MLVFKGDLMQQVCESATNILLFHKFQEKEVNSLKHILSSEASWGGL